MDANYVTVPNKCIHGNGAAKTSHPTSRLATRVVATRLLNLQTTLPTPL